MHDGITRHWKVEHVGRHVHQALGKMRSHVTRQSQKFIMAMWTVQEPSSDALQPLDKPIAVGCLLSGLQLLPP